MGLFRRLRGTFIGRDQQIDDELRSHIEMRADELERQGLGSTEARRQAELAFGNRTVLRERTRDADILIWLESAMHDLRFALRTMRKAPVVTLVAVASLALGIGANTAIFSLMDAVLWKSLPVERPEELVTFSADRSEFPNPVYRELRDRNSVFEGLIASGHTSADLTMNGSPSPET